MIFVFAFRQNVFEVTINNILKFKYEIEQVSRILTLSSSGSLQYIQTSLYRSSGRLFLKFRIRPEF